MRRALLLLMLAACTDPRQACLNAAVEDLRIVQALIADTEATIERGYAIQTETRTAIYTNFCVGTGRSDVGFTFCNYPYPVTTRKPVAVDLNAERRKLTSLRQKERELRRDSLRAQQACETQFPTGA
ncbi:hypothetical protein C8N43_3686 [Litoreibacter ponti]|uniref:Lipoprotein n=1 Tax=Litoreibacter ponti TaxID=1510457 RepID=A0A2T6BFN4_9RHOB|nr:hypothetical protein [Litoreibacter ponti]PTX54864.1 hypothetical protein C8N43_3686 [Litoreibacter ponti]